MSGDTTTRRGAAAGLGIKAGISLLLLAVVIAGNRAAFADVASRRPTAGPFTAALLLYLSGVVLAFYRWYLLVRAQDLPFRVRDALRLGWIGMLFNIVIPGAVGGDVVKAAYLAREQHHKGRAVASVVIDRLVGLLGLFVLALIAGGAAWNSLGPRVRPIIVAAAIACTVVALLLLLVFTIRPHGALSRRLRPGSRGHHTLMELHATGLAYRRRLGWVAASIGMAALTHVANVTAFSLVAAALYGEAAPSALACFTIVPLVLFSTAIPLPFSGLGATESVGAVLFQSVAFPGGAVVMLGFRLLQAVAALIGGWVYLTSPSAVRRPDGVPSAPHAAKSDAVTAPR
jgi:uncharacterized protein (TIRG00374 family)